MTAGRADMDAMRAAGPCSGAPDLLNAALAYAAVGWAVFPAHTPDAKGDCSCSVGRRCENTGKHPRTQHGLKDATTDEAKIRLWWRMWPNANIGIVTGSVSGFFVLDLDPKHGGMEAIADLQLEHGCLPATLCTRTGSGGEHRLHRYPGRSVANSVGRIAPGVDVRGDGGYIIAPPSLHASGRRYEWTTPEDAPLADAPEWLLALVVARAGTAGIGPAPAILGDVADGARNGTLASWAGTMRRRGMSLPAIEAALLVENRLRCKPPLDEGEVRRIAASVSRYEPAAERTDTPAAAGRSVLRSLAGAFAGEEARHV